MKLIQLVSLCVVAGTAAAFAPQQRHISNSQQRLPSLFAALEEVGDPFDSYSTRNPDQELMTKDVVPGTGDQAKVGDVVTVAYTGKLMSTGKQFDTGAGYTFKLGERRVMPGWEKGIPGMRVGGKRKLRVPPNLAYGDRGASDVIPPGSHLEFECELTAIISNPVEAAFQQLNWQNERIITLVLLVILLAVSPSFPAFQIPNPF